MILLEKEQVEGDIIACSPYHASQENISDYAQPALTQLLPLLYEKAATAAMIKHDMNVLKESNSILKSWTSICDCFRCSIVCTGKVCAMESSANTW